MRVYGMAATPLSAQDPLWGAFGAGGRFPGCYAYGDAHLAGGLTLRQFSDVRGDALVEGIVALVSRRHRPVHVTLVGGEPLVRPRELSKVLPRLSAMRVQYPRGDQCRDSDSDGMALDPPAPRGRFRRRPPRAPRRATAPKPPTIGSCRTSRAGAWISAG